MKIYLDSCSLQRPFDDKKQLRICLEAEAILNILSLFEAGKVAIFNSDALFFETDVIPDQERREYAFEILRMTNDYVHLNDIIEKRAKEFTEKNIKPMDALHLASAEYANADYFCTCDDKFLKKALKLKLRIKIVSPLSLTMVFEK